MFTTRDGHIRVFVWSRDHVQHPDKILEPFFHMKKYLKFMNTTDWSICKKLATFHKNDFY